MLKHRTRRVRFWVFLCGMLLALGVLASGAWAVFQPISAGDNFFTAPTSYSMDQGDRPTFTNGGSSTHNVTARQNGPDGKALFSTPSIGGGQTATLSGTQYLTAGSYPFICSIHPTQMSGTLVVTGNGTPQARPHADLAVKSRKLSKVTKRGLLLGVDANTKVDQVSLVAKLGKAVLGRANDVSLASGRQFAVIKLSKSGKSKLSRRSTATVTVTAEIPFGAPATAKGKLR